MAQTILIYLVAVVTRYLRWYAVLRVIPLIFPCKICILNLDKELISSVDRLTFTPTWKFVLLIKFQLKTIFTIFRLFINFHAYDIIYSLTNPPHLA